MDKIENRPYSKRYTHNSQQKTQRGVIKHLYQKQKRRQRKIKQLRKEILEIFTNLDNRACSKLWDKDNSDKESKI